MLQHPQKKKCWIDGRFSEIIAVRKLKRLQDNVVYSRRLAP